MKQVELTDLKAVQNQEIGESHVKKQLSDKSNILSEFIIHET